MLQKFRDLKLSTKFLGSIALILLVLTCLDIAYNSIKERGLAQKEMRRWAFLFTENVLVTLNTLMAEDVMHARFSMIEDMKNDMDTIKDLRLIRSDKTNDLFRQVNERDIFPEMEARLLELEGGLQKGEGKANDKIKAEIEEVKAIIEKRRLMTRTDPGEEARDELDKKVLAEGTPVYRFNGDHARVLMPYIVKDESCSAGIGCHRYAKKGDVLGAINLEVSTVEVQKDIARNNIIMAGFWVVRFVVFLTVIACLLLFLVTRNIRSMLNVFRKMSSGDFSVRAVVKGDDELGQMAKGFNLMAQSLEDTKKELDKSLLEAFALYNIGKAVNTDFEMEKTLLSLVQGLGKSEKIDKTMIMLADKDSGLLRVASYTGFKDGEIDSAARKLGEGFYGAVAAEGKGRLVNEVEKYVDIPSEDVFGAEVNSIIAVPFFRGDSIFGLICAYKNRPDHFDLSDFKLFEGMAEQLTVVLNNAKLVKETKIKATRDGLTGLYNRGFFNESLEKEHEKAVRHGRDLSLFMIDIDDFKYYNDTNGHPEGDRLLKELSDLICRTVRSIDIVCRYGGEEFTVILPEAGKKGAMLIGERLVSAIHLHPLAHEDSQPLGFVSVSAGLATFPGDGDTTDGLLKGADDALYRAKRSGKNRIEMA